ncbi:hypothetical protein [Aquipuribacter sp. MA13-6]|uniref:hypothetical protein n=1 Tax=unclassified Aquipuribacter TaxID=2635084 RepID=UPI003EE9B500
MLDDVFDPFGILAGTAGKIVTDAWTVAMLALWNAGLWVLRMVFYLMDAFITPDLRAAGPAAELYRTTFWLAGALVLIMGLLQLGVSAARRDGGSLARVGIGFAQFAVVWGGWLTYLVALVAACGGLTRALMQSLLNVKSWSAWQPWDPIAVQDVADGTVATVLGLMGLVLWLAALGHLLVILTRAGALIILAATTPLAAAGLLSDSGKDWFWKSLRWTHAAALSPVLMVLVLGVGVQTTTGVANGLADGTLAAIGSALPGVLLILIACFSPLALFKLLAFVDPGTSSGAALRRGLATSGGLQGLLGGGASGGSGSATQATSGDSGGAAGGVAGGSAAGGTVGGGRSAGESAGEDATSARFSQAEQGWLSALGGGAGAAAASGIGFMQRLSATSAAVGVDMASQMGVGSSSYYPDHELHRTTRPDRRPTSSSPGANDSTNGAADPPATGPDGGGPGGGRPDAGPLAGNPGPSAAPSLTPPAPSTGGPTPGATPAGTGAGSAAAGGGTAPAGAGAAGAGAGGAAGAAASVPIVPV